MDFYISKEEVVKSLNTTIGVVEKRHTNPILSNVLIEVDESSLKLTASDLESEISTRSIISNFKSGGKTTAPARKLYDLCRLLPDLTEIHIFLDGYNLKIETELGKYNIPTLPSEDFPLLEPDEVKSQINISSKNLNTIILNTYFVIEIQGRKDYLNGLYLSIDDKTITAVAADGHRMAIDSATLNEAVSENIDGIVPKKAIIAIGKLVGEESENAVIKLGRTTISVNISGTTFVSNLIGRKFPDYEQVIPSGESSTLVVDRKMFSESISRVSVLCGDDYKGIKFLTKENSLIISAINKGGEENLVCEYKGEEIEIGFNVYYLQQILSTINSDKVVIDFFGSKSCIITDPNSNSLKYVVMAFI